MAAETAPDILAAQMGIDSDEAQRLLDRFAGGMTAELLDRSRLAIDGLGSFSIVHEQAQRQKAADGTRYQPPSNQVAFTPRPKSGGDTAAIASVRLDMASDEADRFAQAFVGMVEQVRVAAGRFELRGFGSFTIVSGKYRFQPDPSLEALLNTAYDGLKTIVIPGQSDGKSGSDDAEGRGRIGQTRLLVAALLLLAGSWFLYRHYFSSGFRFTPAPAASTVVPSIEEKPVLAVPPKPPEPDSLLLREGRYTVIVATFASKKGARREWQRLAELGYQIRFWPVTSGGERYYRLVTGDFATRRAALDSMKSMLHGGLPKHSYIQQAHKNVVLYGEQGL